MTRHPRTSRLLALLTAVLGLATSAPAQDERALNQLRGVDVDEHIGRTLPLELQFTNDKGEKVTLGDYFGKGDSRPVVLGLVYYKCPVVCDIFMAKTAGMMGSIDYTPGTEYRTLLFSFDPRESTEDAADAKELYFKSFAKPVTDSVRAGWVYHTSDAETAKQLADAVGFRYKQMPDGNFTHPVCKFIITPDGKISRYLYGYDQDPRDLKLAILEAAQGKLTPTVGERIMAFCYVFDPSMGKYTLRAMRVMQVGGGATLIGLSVLIGLLFLGERARRRAARLVSDHAPGITGGHSGVRP